MSIYKPGNHEGPGAAATTKVWQGQQPTLVNQFKMPQTRFQPRVELHPMTLVPRHQVNKDVAHHQNKYWKYNVGMKHAPSLNYIGVTANVITSLRYYKSV
jgi:hypothetical protein